MNPPSVPQIDVTMGHVIDRTWPPIKVDFPDGVTMTPAIQYSTPPSCRPLTLDLYRPGVDAEGGHPILIFIHGGSWARGDSRSSRPLRRFPWVLAALAATGYVIASIEYRLVGEAIWPAQAQDVKSAIKFLRANAELYGGDPSRIGVWGASCGGHLAAIAATTSGASELASRDESLIDVSETVQAAVAWFGGFNMASITEQCAQLPGCYPRTDRSAPEWSLLGGMPHEVDPGFLRSAGPINYVSPSSAPMLLIAGDCDLLIPPQQSIEMAERLAAAGGQVQLEIMAGVGHDFAGETEDQTRAANQQALHVTMMFLDALLKARRT
ncbi:alpha/beta hydrolase [Novosphingobium sp. KN65.2]|uniref:alpha/beta hydrolase n=1 Tax=Novosphingobium sp. KN65.2 TaxID=1478134 RepID=UPI0005DF7491